MVSTRDRLVQIVTAEPGKYYEAELGRVLGVRRQRVHTIAVKEELHHLIKPYWSSHFCLDCGRYTKSQLRLCRSCRRKYFRAECVCDECGQVFIRRRCDIRGYKHHFCSERCKGKYFFGSHRPIRVSI